MTSFPRQQIRGKGASADGSSGVRLMQDPITHLGFKSVLYSAPRMAWTIIGNLTSRCDDDAPGDQPQLLPAGAPPNQTDCFHRSRGTTLELLAGRKLTDHRRAGCRLLTDVGVLSARSAARRPCTRRILPDHHGLWVDRQGDERRIRHSFDGATFSEPVPASSGH